MNNKINLMIIISSVMMLSSCTSGEVASFLETTNKVLSGGKSNEIDMGFKPSKPDPKKEAEYEENRKKFKEKENAGLVNLLMILSVVGAHRIRHTKEQTEVSNIHGNGDKKTRPACMLCPLNVIPSLFPITKVLLNHGITQDAFLISSRIITSSCIK